jgi:hypothetical protein
MGWETRGGTKRYYTRSKRVNGRVVREYFGRGEKAQEAARQDHMQRVERQTRRRELALELARWDALERVALEYRNAVEIVSRAMILCAGYHYHRGELRKRRVPKEQRKAGRDGQRTGTEGKPTAAEPRPDASDRQPSDADAPRQASADAAGGGEPEAATARTSAADRPARRRPVPRRRAFAFHGGFRRGRFDSRGHRGRSGSMTGGNVRRIRFAAQTIARQVLGQRVADGLRPPTAARGARSRIARRAASVGSGRAARPPPVAGLDTRRWRRPICPPQRKLT